MDKTDEETVTVSKKSILSLIEDSQKLQHLQWQGVDNWAGYSEVDWSSINDESAEAELLTILR